MARRLSRREPVACAAFDSPTHLVYTPHVDRPCGAFDALISRSGGAGRRGALKMRCPFGRVGSNPTSGILQKLYIAPWGGALERQLPAPHPAATHRG